MYYRGQNHIIKIELVKHICLFIVVFMAMLWSVKVFAADAVEINEANFPDESIRFYAQNADIDKDGYLTDEEASTITEINMYDKGVGTLKGIEYFQELAELCCDNNRLIEIDISQNPKLKYISCMENNISNIEFGDIHEIKSLFLNGNNLTSLDLRGLKKLDYLECASNRLVSLDVSGLDNINDIYCEDNRLTTLDLSKNLTLERVNCSRNKLMQLNLGDNYNLEYVDCSKNKLSNINVSDNSALSSLNCSENHLNSVDVSKNNALLRLNCSENNIGKLKLSHNKLLKHLDISHTGLKSINLKKNELLIDLKSVGTEIKIFDLRNNVFLEDFDCSGCSQATIKLFKKPERSMCIDSDSKILISGKPKSVKAKANSKRIRVTWDKVNGTNAVKYELRYSTSPDMVGAKSLKTAKTKKNLNGLEKNTKYYIQVRSYKTVTGEKGVSAWSKKISVTA